jgi:SPX domain protein involved in polyphosphate accumulation
MKMFKKALIYKVQMKKQCLRSRSKYFLKYVTINALIKLKLEQNPNHLGWMNWKYWSEARNLMNIGILVTSTYPVLLTSKCPQALEKYELR